MFYQILLFFLPNPLRIIFLIKYFPFSYCRFHKSITNKIIAHKTELMRQGYSLRIGETEKLIREKQTVLEPEIIFLPHDYKDY